MPRSVSGLIVPFGIVVNRGWWRARYSPGSLSVTDVSRVPFAFEHLGNREVIGVMTDVEERPATKLELPGVYGEFDLDDSPYGDRAAAEFSTRSRWGLSMGIGYDDATIDAIWEAMWDEDDGVVDAAGIIREVSDVALPAFDDSRGQLAQQA